MGKQGKLILKVIEGHSDRNVSFNELCELLKRLGFQERIRGSHHIFRMTGITEMCNLQKDGKHAKPYQIRQVRAILVKYGLLGVD
ncbi:MAG: type II toxin-antitoxin system HicA family toxin [Proteobacteria bacterium]|nr:type II toxin-antitoxin system HicA family toxin [Pseudomonadota bacterium]